MVKEVISLHIGQAGCQIGNACWELYCLEHGLNVEGFVNKKLHCQNEVINSFFYELPDRKHVPRAIYADFDSTLIDEVRVGCYKNLFNPKFLISGTGDAATYARGFHVAEDILEPVLEKIRKMSENSDNLNEVLIFHSFSGGTGSGFTSLLMKHLHEIYEKQTRVQFAVMPSPNLQSHPVGPYNSIMAAHGTIEHSDCCFLVDNEALYDVCSERLNLHNPTLTNINRMLVQVASGITANLRFCGSNLNDLRDICNNLMPYLRLHFPMVTFSPMKKFYKGFKSDLSLSEITDICFEPSSQFLKIEDYTQNYLTCCFLYRGSVNPNEFSALNARFKILKKTIVRNCKQEFSLGYRNNPPCFVPDGTFDKVDQSVCMLTNNTAIKQSWALLNEKFKKMYDRRAFVHSYLADGMYKEDFQEAQQDIVNLEREYCEILKD